ncbi:MAG TPA: hypothetical protein VFW83_00120 [Bryobacteraceae bacterium]|nr:hypothetical protein [Bryobacteraceae bacterium]
MTRFAEGYWVGRARFVPKTFPLGAEQRFRWERALATADANRG